MLAVTVIKNTVTKRPCNFQIRFLPYSNAFELDFFPNMFFYHFLQLKLKLKILGPKLKTEPKI